MSDEQKDLTMKEISKLGIKALKEKYGRAHFVAAGKKGGATTKARHGRKHYEALGRRGGGACLAKHGLEHYAAMGRRAGERIRNLICRGKAAEAGEADEAGG